MELALPAADPEAGARQARAIASCSKDRDDVRALRFFRDTAFVSAAVLHTHLAYDELTTGSPGREGSRRT